MKWAGVVRIALRRVVVAHLRRVALRLAALGWIILSRVVLMLACLNVEAMRVGHLHCSVAHRFFLHPLNDDNDDNDNDDRDKNDRQSNDEDPCPSGKAALARPRVRVGIGATTICVFAGTRDAVPFTRIVPPGRTCDRGDARRTDIERAEVDVNA